MQTKSHKNIKNLHTSKTQSLSDLALEKLPDCERTVTNGALGFVRTDLTLPSGDAVATLHTPSMSGDRGVYVSSALTQVLREYAPNAINILFVGLGNADFVCDAVGVAAAAKLSPTRLLSSPVRKLSVFVPGVAGRTGLDTAESVLAIAERINPDLVIVCDALAARDPTHIGTTIQVTTAGLAPASGVGADSFALNRATLGAATVAVGIPTVVRAGVLAADILESLTLNATDRMKEKMLAKLLGSPSSSMVVSPKEIDLLVANAANVVAQAVTDFVLRPSSPVIKRGNQAQ